ncbi:hypothetical protein [Sphingomonas sp. SAFR-052]|uniref:hypothetical protein n=1 Tax=Sphingomonas sp. SAFR-052 TaxID=3436867 RepID=UPI003F7DD7FD
MNAPINPRSISAPPTREEIFELVSPLFSAVNSQHLAINELIAEDRPAALTALRESEQALDEALAAFKQFLGVAP